MSPARNPTTPEPAQAGLGLVVEENTRLLEAYRAKGPHILALDLSLTSTGLCRPDGSVRAIRTEPRRGMERLAFIRDEVMSEATVPWGPGRYMYVDLVMLEGYSHGSIQQAHYLGELGGVIRLALYEARIPYVDVQPTQRAKYATGKGNAGKSLVVQHAAAMAERIFDCDDCADAWWLWQMGLARYGKQSPYLVRRPKVNLEALDAIVWPA